MDTKLLLSVTSGDMFFFKVRESLKKTYRYCGIPHHNWTSVSPSTSKILT